LGHGRGCRGLFPGFIPLGAAISAHAWQWIPVFFGVEVAAFETTSDGAHLFPIEPT